MKVELFLQYPKIRSSELCDGAWHHISVEGLYQVADCPWLFVMQYHDDEFNKQCIATLAYIEGVFYKAPLIWYGDLFTAINGSLVSVDFDNLPVAIEAKEVSFDLTDLTLRMLEKGYVTTRCAAASPPPPPSRPPQGASYGRNDGRRHKYAVNANPPNGSNNPFELPSKEGQAQLTDKGSCRIATLFICDCVIYFGEITPQGMSYVRPSRDELIFALTHYFIVWRTVDFHLIKDSRVIAAAIDDFRKICFDDGIDLVVQEVYVYSNEARMAGFLPTWLCGVAHRYAVCACVHKKPNA